MRIGAEVNRYGSGTSVVRRVAAGAAIDRIGASTAANDVVPRITGQAVGVRLTDQVLHAGNVVACSIAASVDVRCKVDRDG